MENGKAKQLLDRIQDIVGEGQNVPFAAGKVLVNKEEVLEIVEELKTTIDLELKAYHEITDKRSKISFRQTAHLYASVSSNPTI